MVYDIIDRAPLYAAGFKRFADAIGFIRSAGRSVKDGRYRIGMSGAYAIVTSYRTKPGRAAPFEAHRKYIDLQYMLAGEERIDVAHGPGLRVRARYSSAKDAAFFHPPKTFSSIIMKPGRFAVFYPHDLHRPCRSIGRPAAVRKIVVKIPV